MAVKRATTLNAVEEPSLEESTTNQETSHEEKNGRTGNAGLTALAPNRVTPDGDIVPGPVAAKVKQKKKRTARSYIMPILLLVVLGFGADYGYHELVFNQNHEVTDDAQVDGNIDPVLPRIAGYVSAVYVNDNVAVKSGQILVVLDTADLFLKARAAETAIANSSAAVIVSEANVNTAQVNQRKTQTDLARDTKLLAAGAITQAQFDVTKANADAAEAQLAATGDQITVAKAQVEQRQVELAQARLQLSYATVKAPADGVISRKSVQVGQYIQVAQPLMAVTENDSIWITANFKETQVEDIRPGQAVEIDVDAYPHTIFHGRVQSFSAATGAKFSLLPPDNATGNFVKVVQRMPVKILLEGKVDPSTPLRPGMSVSATVTTK